MGQIRRSDYLNVVPHVAGGYVGFHRLFGNLTTLNESAVQLLGLFAQGLAESDVASLAQQYGPWLRSFHEMYYLVEEDLDERRVLDESLSERQQQLGSGRYIGGVQLSVSDACNFACTYCFCDFVDARGPERRALAGGSKMMTFEVATRTIDTLLENAKRTGKGALVVKFFGREPLINWPLIKRLLAHYEHGESRGVHIAYAITTNASLVTDEIAETLARYRVRTTVSIDGLEASNDVVRLSKKPGENTFTLIHDGIRRLQEHGALDVLSAVITDRNFDAFDVRFVDYARARGAGEIQVLLGMQGDFIRRIDPQVVADKLFEIHAYGRGRGVAVTGYWHNAINEVLSCRKLRSEPRMIRGPVESCTATGHQISVEPSGDVFPCRAMSTHVGHIDDFAGMLRSPAYRHVVMRTYGNVKECHGCTIEGFCQGECLGNLEERFADIYRVDRAYCEIYRNVYDKILAHL